MQDHLRLFRSPLQARLLELLVADPDVALTNRELRERLEATEASVHRELQRALGAGVLVREPVGRTFRYRAARSSPLHEPLRELLRRIVGFNAELKELLESEPGVELAALHGSWVSGQLRPTSDVDLLVLGEPELHRLRRGLNEVERRHGRRIDVTVLTRQEFADRLRRGNSFARSIAEQPRELLVGQDDLLRVA